MMNNRANYIQSFNKLLVAILFGCFVFRVECLNFSYTEFTNQNYEDFITTQNSSIALNAIQVTSDARGAQIENLSGRIWYKHPFKLWSKRKNLTASFNSTFVLNITPNITRGLPNNDSWGDGLAFILTKESGSGFIPENSQGKWLGIVNASTNGSSASNIVAVEFDTKKSYLEDIDGNHVGVDVNSVYSNEQVPLTNYGVNISTATDIDFGVQYDGGTKELMVCVFKTNNTTGESMKIPIISLFLDLSDYLPEDVYVGFSASTGEYPELNCIKSWSFTSTEIDDATDKSWVLWMGIAIILVVALVSGVFFYLYWKRKNQDKQVSDEDPRVEQQIQSSATAPQKFNLKELKHATGNFDPRNMIGRGGCGIVYKGLLSNKEVAVKRFLNSSSQGKQDFIAEVSIIGNLHHRNLVRLVGWCYESNELLVVYDFMPNGSLEKIIFRDKKEDTKLPRLCWERRHAVIFGVAQALDYLHNGCENRVLHRDIKASNIMLDSEFNARLGDFGLARTIQGSGKTHHSTKEIAGTPGYMAPESFHTGKATVETDLYAFGVLILEVACQRRPGIQTEHNSYNNRIVDWVWGLHAMERIIDAVDVGVNRPFEEEQVERVLKLGLACCHPNPYERPSMRIVLQVLTGEASPPPILRQKPIFTWPAMAPSFNQNFYDSLTGGQLSPITVLIGR